MKLLYTTEWKVLIFTGTSALCISTTELHIRVQSVSVQPYSLSCGPVRQRMEYWKCMLQLQNIRLKRLRGWDVKYRQTAYLRISVPRSFSFPLGGCAYNLFEMPRQYSCLKRFSKIFMNTDPMSVQQLCSWLLC